MSDVLEIFMNLIKSIRFGLLSGVLVSVLVTSVITAWEWLENPGGIFRGAEGTNWNFVLETAISWLVPTLVWTTIVALAFHLLVSGIRHAVANRARDERNQDDLKD